MQTLHIVTALAGVAGCCCNAADIAPSSDPAASLRRPCWRLLANAAITGGLSGPHDRYQSRIMWLPPLVAVICLASLRRPVPRLHSPMKQSHAANVFWSGLEAAISALLSFASAFIVARLVGPAEVGIGAAAIAVHVLLWVTVNALFADALVQRSVVEDDTFSSAFVASIAVGCAAALAAGGVRPILWRGRWQTTDWS